MISEFNNFSRFMGNLCRARHACNWAQSAIFFVGFIWAYSNSIEAQTTAQPELAGQAGAAAGSAEAHPGQDIETLFAEASIAANTGKRNEALTRLDRILILDPNHREAMEMRALLLKLNGNTEESLRNYLKLITLRPDPETGAYHFEAGNIYFQQKKLGLAKVQFEHSFRLEFNPVTSRFFLGLIGFQTDETEEAIRCFEYVRKRAPEDLKLAASYYLGLAYFKQSIFMEGLININEARVHASRPEQKDNKTAKDILKGANAVLDPFGSGRFFGSFSLGAAYDGNAGLSAGGALAPDFASGKSTFKVNGAAGGGYMTSPLKVLQWIGSLRASANKNFNSLTKNYEFATLSESMLWSLFPLGRTGLILRTNANGAFKNTTLDGSLGGDALYRPYYVTGDLGPTFRLNLTPSFTLNIDGAAKPQIYFSDTDRNGAAYGAHLGGQWDWDSDAFNPGFQLGYEYNLAIGPTNQYGTLTGGISNSFRFSATHSLVASLDASWTQYGAVGRSDKMISAHLLWVKNFNRIVGISADAGVVKNFSSDDATYGYFQPTLGCGVSLTL